MEVGPLLSAAVQAEESDRDLLASHSAEEVLSRFVEIAATHGVTAVVGAGAAGQRLVGALVFHARGELHLWDWVSAERVLVVDGVVASSVGVLSTMELVKRRGATMVVGAAMSAPIGAMGVASGVASASTPLGPELEVFAA